MAVEVCAVLLAAGEGTRLRPLTQRVPKALCPVGNVPLLDWALARVESVGLKGPADVAVNACWLGEQVVAHVGDRAHLSVEPGSPLGTAGGVGKLVPWIAGRGVLVGNADAYLGKDSGVASLARLLAGWDGRTVRLLGVPTDPADPFRFGAHRFAGLSLLPWSDVRDLPATPHELVRAVWRPAERAGRLEVIEHRGPYVDTGTPADYLAANLDAADGSVVSPLATVHGRVTGSVVGAGATVDGDVTRCVVWPGAHVPAGESLVDAIRAPGDLTVRVAG